MIQELLSGGLVEDSKIKISLDGGLLVGSVTDGPSSCSSQSSASSAAASPSNSTATAASNSLPQNLQCPRCDSTNTKFCYYNNYNLTQPRHFCKTCRRYWTKGGALRNVPIGGGCRKTKGNGISVGAGKSGAAGGGNKAKILASEVVVGKSGLGGALGLGGGGAVFEYELPTGPVLRATPQNSHLLPLIRATQRSGINNNTNSSNISTTTIPNRRPSTNPNPVRNEEEGSLIGSHLVPEASLLRNAFNARNYTGVDPLAPVALVLSTSLWSNQYQYPHRHRDQQLPQQQQRQAQQQNGLLLGEAPTSGIQELYQMLRSSGNHYADYLLGNVGNPSSSSSSSISLSTAVAATTTATPATSTSSILDQTAVAGGEFGYWSSPFAWADMPTSNGAFL